MTKYIKYPRTPKLLIEGVLNAPDDDIKVRMDSVSNLFSGDREMVVTIKMDGENTTIYNDHVHARSISSRNHPSRGRIKAKQAEIGYKIPDNMRLCGENMTALHTIHYMDLEDYFLLFSVWKENLCLSWSSVEAIAEALRMKTVPVLYQGTLTEDDVYNWIEYIEGTDHEGLVFRSANSFSYDNFSSNIVKYVRPRFQQQMSEDHWMSKTFVPNKLKTSEYKEEAKKAAARIKSPLFTDTPS